MSPFAALLLVMAQSATPVPLETPGITRIDLQQHDLSLIGWQSIQTRVDFAPGAVATRHMHPGEELVYVLKGTLEYRIEGQPRITLKPGDVLFIPYGKLHSVVNVGLEPASELATYVVEKGRPLVVTLPER